MFEVPAWVHDTPHRQLEMNPQTWAALREHGVNESTDLHGCDFDGWGAEVP
jgi:hypothetical protein